MTYELIYANRDQFPVVRMAEVLDVSRSGYYHWKREPISKRQRADMDLTTKIKKVFKVSGETYGSPRVYRDLKEEGIPCSRGRIERLMKESDLVAKAARKYKATTDSDHPHPPSPDLLSRHFETDEPDRAWVSDITYIRTQEGWLYLCTVIDLFSRRVVGFAQSKRIKADLVVRAIHMSVDARRPNEGLIFHSDRGSQYASKKVRKLLKKLGLRQSMGSKGDAYDNAAAESFFHTLKVELVHWVRYVTRAEAKTSLFRYIELFYNRKRRHSHCGQISPASYERAYWSSKLEVAA